jgi:hypothetical protein
LVANIIFQQPPKDNFARVDERETLTQLATVPIETWNYKSQPASIRDIGPMTQDFRVAFGVGEDDTQINTVDADGVALAAIQGVSRLAQEKDAQSAALAARVSALEAARPEAARCADLSH